MYALRTNETIRQYPKRLKIFFDYGLDSSLNLEEQAILFYKKSIENKGWTYFCSISAIEPCNNSKELDIFGLGCC